MATTLTPSRALRRPHRLDLRVLVGAAVAAVAFCGTLIAFHGLQSSREVLLVTHDLPPGAALRAEDLRAEAVRLDDQTYAAAISASDAGTVVGRALAGSAYANQILVRAQLQARSALLPGQEAFVVPVPQDTGSALHLQPGDDVQILWTEGKGQPNAPARVLMDRVRVLDVTRAPASDVVSTEASPVSTRVASLTLAVTTEQAAELAAAKGSGSLDMALLPPAEGAEH